MGGVKKKYYKWSKNDLEQALQALEMQKMSLNRISSLYSVPKPTILRHARKSNKIANITEIQKGRPNTLNAELENILVNHILEFESHLFGLTINDVRKLAFDVAEKHKISHKFNKERQMAGKAWFYAFKGRHSELNIGHLERTSINYKKGFKKQSVNVFYDLLKKIIEENGLRANKVYNIDQCHFSTAQKKPQKVVGLKGTKGIGTFASGEKGINTTAICCVSVAGHFVPPMLILRRTRLSPKLKNGAPPGIVITVSDSGYINSALFIQWIKHFISKVKPSPKNKVLILLDGDTTHCKNLEALHLANKNGIIMLQLPGHSINRLQPLDTCFFNPMRSYYIQAVEKWLQDNSSHLLTQYQVASLFAEAYERTAMISNISDGFEETGIWPVIRYVFSEQIIQPIRNIKTGSVHDSNNKCIVILEESSTISTSNAKEKIFLNQSNSSDISDEMDIVDKESHSTIKIKDMRHSVNRKPHTSESKTKYRKTSLKSLHPLAREMQRKKMTKIKETKRNSSYYKNKLELLEIKQKKYSKKNKIIQQRATEKTHVSNKSIDEKYVTKCLEQKRSSISSDNYEDVILEISDDTDWDSDKEDITMNEKGHVCASCDCSYYDKNKPSIDWFECVHCHRWVHVRFATIT